MFKSTLKYSLLFAFVLLTSCGSKKKVIQQKKPNKTNKTVVVKTNEITKPKTETPTLNKPAKPLTTTQHYINRYANIAKTEMRKYNIPASITLAQGILESGSGKGRLSKEANNHFGIKCHGWQGAKIYHDDDRLQECFRKYKKAEQSFEDHSKFLTGRKRYANLFKLKQNDYKSWAKGLRSAGYATDKKYPQKLISLIERYQLYKYDEEVLGTPTPKSVVNTTNYTVKKGDTLYSIAKRFNVSVSALKTENNLENNQIQINQVLKITTN